MSMLYRPNTHLIGSDMPSTSVEEWSGSCSPKREMPLRGDLEQNKQCPSRKDPVMMWHEKRGTFRIVFGVETRNRTFFLSRRFKTIQNKTNSQIWNSCAVVFEIDLKSFCQIQRGVWVSEAFSAAAYCTCAPFWSKDLDQTHCQKWSPMHLYCCAAVSGTRSLNDVGYTRTHVLIG